MKFFLLLIFLLNILKANELHDYSYLYIYNDYLKKLNNNCNTNHCCISSVQWMLKNRLYLKSDFKECKKSNLYKCKGSYEWCEDKIYEKEKIKYLNNQKNILTN
jgi:hypothetical protein